jgi:hypothetical protein
MKWVQTTNEWWDSFLRQQAEKGKWSFVLRIGVIGWGGLMVVATNHWFDRWTNYHPLTVLVVSLLLWLPAGAIVGLGLYTVAQRTDDERREFWLRQKQRGVVSFVLRYGVFGMGVPLFVLFTAFCLLTLGFRFHGLISFNFASCLTAGTLFGLLLWSRCEKKYQ